MVGVKRRSMNQSDIRMRQNVCRRLSAARRRQKYEPGLMPTSTRLSVKLSQRLRGSEVQQFVCSRGISITARVLFTNHRTSHAPQAAAALIHRSVYAPSFSLYNYPFKNRKQALYISFSICHKKNKKQVGPTANYPRFPNNYNKENEKGYYRPSP